MAPKMASTKIFMATRGQIDRNQNCFGKSGSSMDLLKYFKLTSEDIKNKIEQIV